MRLAPNQTVILGPPGCGKTTELLRLLETHLENGGEAQRIAYFSFTRKAVEVAKSRAVDRFNITREELPFFRTVHSMVFALNGHSKNDVIGRAHYAEISDALGLSFTGGKVDESTGLPAGNGEGDQHLFLDGLARARRVPLLRQWEELGRTDIDFRNLERTVTAVTRYKKANALVDFTDMLEIYERDGFPIDVDVAFIDEAQDLSALQWDVLRRVLQNCETVYVAGDDDQAIYRWSGADVESFLALEGGQTVLTQSWRCPQLVHRIANSISERIRYRFTKHWDARAVRGAVTRVNSIDGFDLAALDGSTLLLARNTYLLTGYTDQLRRRGLAYRTAHGTHSVTRNHAKAIYAYTRLQKGHAISGFDAKIVYDHLRAGIGVKRGFKSLPGLSNTADVTEATLRADYGLLAQGPWYDALDGISGNDRMYYRSVLRGGGSLLDEPTIQVSTVHGVKGGEADNVVVCPDMAWQSYQHYERDADDEHRVAYVAVSRAKKHLFLMSPLTKNFYPYA